MVCAEVAEIGKLYLFDKGNYGYYYERNSFGNRIFHQIKIEKNEPIFLIERKYIKTIGEIQFLLAYVLTRQGIFYLNFSNVKLEEI
jgi:hypothetical protein